MIKKSVLFAVICAILLAYVFQPVYASSNILSLSFYTYPDMDLTTISVDFDINDQGDWQIFSINTDKDLSHISAIVVVEGGNLYELFSKITSIDYDNQNKHWVRELTVGGNTFLHWEKISENMWLWRF